MTINARTLLSAIGVVCYIGSFGQSVPVMTGAFWWHFVPGQWWVPNDSVVFTHSGINNSIAYPTTVDGNHITYKYDTAQHFYIDSYGSWATSGKEYIILNKDGNEIEHSDYNYKTITIYNSFKLIDSVIEYYHDFVNGWIPVGYTFHKYDGKNNIVERKFESGAGNNKSYFIDSFFYDLAGNMVRHNTKYLNAGQPWASGNNHTYAYSTNNVKITDTFFSKDAIYAYHTVYKYNSIGLMDSALDYNVTKLNAFKKYTYDVNNNLIKIQWYNWDSSSNSYIVGQPFTYQYNDYSQIVEAFEVGDWYTYSYGLFPINISSIKMDMVINLYPVPATAYINLEMNFDKPESFGVAITDMQGRVVRQWTETNVQQYKKFIPVMDLAPGAYTIQVNGKEKMSKNFTVIR